MKRSLLPFLALLFCACGEDARVAGNGTFIGNGLASGRVVEPDGSPAAGVWIECTPLSSAPWDARPVGWSDLTDSVGSYECSDLPEGVVGIAAYAPGSGLTRWRATPISQGAAPHAAPDTLASPGSIRIALPAPTTGTLHLAGLSRTFALHGDSAITITDVPAHWSGNLFIASSANSSTLLDSGLHVAPGGSDSSGFKRRGARIRIPLAGGLIRSLVHLPLLVRFDSSWSGFLSSMPDGSDLRAAGIDGKPLPLTVASWDREGRQGALWILADSIAAPGDAFDIDLSWGLPEPSTTASPVFSATNGWSATWPLGDTGSIARDLTGSHDGNAFALRSVPGVVGNASSFDGSDAHVAIPLSDTGALALPEKGGYTLSCWALLEEFKTSRFLLGHGEYGSHLKFQADLDADSNLWLASDFRNTPAGGFVSAARATTGTWTHLAMTFSDTTVALYVDGIRRQVASGFFKQSTGRRAVPFAIGAGIDTTGAPDKLFRGLIDEVWALDGPRDGEWIRFIAANQRPGAPVAQTVW